jgi:hypothetical protein
VDINQKPRISKIRSEKHENIKNKEDQHLDTSFLLRIEDKIPMEGVTETHFELRQKDGSFP